MTQTATVAAAAAAWHAAGYSVVPARSDGSKAPISAWKRYTQQPANVEQITAWYAGDHPGLGLVCGAVSGNLEMLELEGRAVAGGALDQLRELVLASGLAELWRRLTVDGYAEGTPSGGLHLLYRLADAPVPGNTKLARNAAGEVLAETRGEGGYVVVAPSHGPVHPTGGAWTIVIGEPGRVPTITAAERADLHALVRLLDEQATPSPADEAVTSGQFTAPAAPAPPPGQLSPGDDFEARVDWSDQLLLGGAGWRQVYRQAQIRYWRRPGKQVGISATTGAAGDRDRLYVFSTSTPFDAEVPYTKFGAYALLHHAGDHTAAATTLRDLGYGTPTLPALPPATAGPAGTNPPSPVPTDHTDPTSPTDVHLQQLTTMETLRLRARRAAEATLRAESAARTPPPAFVALPELLAEPDEPVRYLIDGLWPAGGRVMLVAQAKAGKTTLRDNLVRALADNQPFLDRFGIGEPTDKPGIVVIDTELSRGNLRRWLREQHITNPSHITVVALRGAVASFDIVDETHRAEWVSRIRKANANIVVLDCLGPVLAAFGMDEKDNRDVGRFLVAFETLLAESGVDNALIVHHMGHDSERGRGASRLRDWPDAEWRLVLDPDPDSGARYLTAVGRDVELPETELRYDQATRRLGVTAGGTRAEVAASRRLGVVVDFVAANPGLTQNAIQAGLAEVAGRNEVRKLLREAVVAGLVRIDQPNNRDRLHYPGTDQERSNCATDRATRRSFTDVELRHPGAVATDCAGNPAATPPVRSGAVPSCEVQEVDQVARSVTPPVSPAESEAARSPVRLVAPVNGGCPCGSHRHAAGDLAPCPRCGNVYHRHGGKRLRQCPSCTQHPERNR